jgi:hypothetical protein
MNSWRDAARNDIARTTKCGLSVAASSNQVRPVCCRFKQPSAASLLPLQATKCGQTVANSSNRGLPTEIFFILPALLPTLLPCMRFARLPPPESMKSAIALSYCNSIASDRFFRWRDADLNDIFGQPIGPTSVVCCCLKQPSAASLLLLQANHVKVVEEALLEILLTI